MNQIRILATALCLFVSAASVSWGQATDPTEDTLGSGAMQLDIASINVTYSAIDVNFAIRFANPIAAPSSGALNGLFGYIDLDTDQNEDTGETSFAAAYGPSSDLALGDGFFIDLGSEATHRGYVDIIDASTTSTTGLAQISYLGEPVSLVAPLAVLGNDDGLLNYAAIVGTSEEVTDVAPNGASPLTSIAAPEPCSAAVVALGFLAVAAMAFRRRAY